MGVRNELCRVEIAHGIRTRAIVEVAFNKFWEGLVQASGIGPVAAIMKAPEPIHFSNCSLAEWPVDFDCDKEVSIDLNRAFFYTRQLATLHAVDNNTPPIDFKQVLSGVVDLLSRKPLAMVRAEADATGYAGKPNREVYRRYLVGVITSDTASDVDKARAHGLLIDWCITVFPQEIYMRYIHAAAHHANESVRLAGKSFCAVLWFASKILEPLSKQSLDLRVQYQAVWDAYNKRNEEIDRDTAQAEKKRAKKSNRYVCAAVECLIQADKGKLLFQIHDLALLERADWKTHKPFCKPGAACSILEKDKVLPTAGKTDMQGSISIPIVGPDGKTIVVSTSSMSPEILKEVRKIPEERAAQLSANEDRPFGRVGGKQIEKFSLA
ncbi:hypothetical protein C0993_001056 [Termitomyces sp. T159_Od127]|nr:hypothetical protein C0993_001056 [Termitomyces sp. T159_Od127]